MTNSELREARQSLGLSVEWCAAHVGSVSLRTWNYWESGRNDKVVPVPDDVQRRMRALLRAVPKSLV